MLQPLTGPRIGVVVPVLNGARHLPDQLAALSKSTTRDLAIWVIDSASTDDSVAIATGAGVKLRSIQRRDFNHGATRNLGADLLREDSCGIFVFLTQDAFPVDADFIDRLTEPLRSGRAGAAYGRQVPYPDADPPEVFARSFNYPSHGSIRLAGDMPTLGLKAFFFSNVASAVRADVFAEVGGFPDGVIMNEDMVLCARVMKAGHPVAYCADAVVLHSHNYTIAQQFRRYFDIGAFLAESQEVRGAVGGEGLRFVRGQLGWCWSHGARSWVARCLVEAAAKFIGMHLGKRHRLLPRWLKRRCSMHAFHWR